MEIITWKCACYLKLFYFSVCFHYTFDSIFFLFMLPETLLINFFMITMKSFICAVFQKPSQVWKRTQVSTQACSFTSYSRVTLLGRGEVLTKIQALDADSEGPPEWQPPGSLCHCCYIAYPGVNIYSRLLSVITTACAGVIIPPPCPPSTKIESYVSRILKALIFPFSILAWHLKAFKHILKFNNLDRILFLFICSNGT